MAELTIAERVAAGAAWLDTQLPAWALRLDLDTLAMDSECRCILGQNYMDYYLAPLVVAGGNEVDAAEERARADLGLQSYAVADAKRDGWWFDGDDRSLQRDAEYDALYAEWKRVVLARRAEVSRG